MVLLAEPILYCKTTNSSPFQYYLMIYSQFLLSLIAWRFGILPQHPATLPLSPIRPLLVSDNACPISSSSCCQPFCEFITCPSPPPSSQPASPPLSALPALPTILKSHVPTLQHVPKGARDGWALTLSSCLRILTSYPSCPASSGDVSPSVLGRW